MTDPTSPSTAAGGPTVTVDGIRALTGAATPHFAQQVRERVLRLVADLPADDPARIVAEQEAERLLTLGHTGEVRGTQNEPTLEPLDSVTKED